MLGCNNLRLVNVWSSPASVALAQDGHAGPMKTTSGGFHEPAGGLVFLALRPFVLCRGRLCRTGPFSERTSGRHVGCEAESRAGKDDSSRRGCVCVRAGLGWAGKHTTHNILYTYHMHAYIMIQAYVLWAWYITYYLHFGLFGSLSIYACTIRALFKNSSANPGSYLLFMVRSRNLSSTNLCYK